MKDKPYSQAEAELAAGMGSFSVHVTRNGKLLDTNNKNVNKTKRAASMDTLSSPASSLVSTSTVMEGLSIG